ncbi:hypothetical protein [Nocardioides maradonensis]
MPFTVRLHVKRSTWSAGIAHAVTFYDARYPFTEYGQQIASYYLSTILGSTAGICLDGGAPDWWIDSATMADIRAWLESQLITERT